MRLDEELDLNLVQTSIESDHDLSGAVIVDDLEFANVTVLHHDGQELDDHLRTWPQENLTFVAFLRVVKRLERIGQRIHANHFSLVATSFFKKSCLLKRDKRPFVGRLDID